MKKSRIIKKSIKGLHSGEIYVKINYLGLGDLLWKKYTAFPFQK